jgi:two-component system, cell cycle sensor histidine kinase and response regulator CckA
LAAKYDVDVKELTRHAETYESRPPFIIELAKRRLAVSARLIGEIVQRKQAQGEREQLQSQLIQAQKMESVGRLAGGVAHDFNNMLAAILGHIELAMEQVDSTQPVHADLLEIQTAARRSTELTHQLLAFARKQTIQPQVTDLNHAVAGMLKMLRRLIGEQIDLIFQPHEGLWAVKVDPSQIDQILANLCVNARDAIDDVGSITIATANSVLDQDYCTRHTGCVVGEYLQLTVSDNGRGMDKKTQTRLFEPFFTTKEIGKGTGLGLATVYGIVKQNRGFIDVYSELGHGTTFKIHLPRHVGEARLTVECTKRSLELGSETILLVEDEPSILSMTKRMLERQGYTVVAASTPREAIRLATEHPIQVHLLITDVIMPEMNGRDLVKQLVSTFPSLKRLFMSGYTANAIVHHGVLDKGVHFIQKPFTGEELATKVRGALGDSYEAGS